MFYKVLNFNLNLTIGFLYMLKNKSGLSYQTNNVLKMFHQSGEKLKK